MIILKSLKQHFLFGTFFMLFLQYEFKLGKNESAYKKNI